MAVVAAADPFFTEVPVAFVVRKPGDTMPHPILTEELRNLVIERIGDWTQLRRFIYLNSLPPTPSKKIQRSALRLSLAAHGARRLPR